MLERVRLPIQGRNVIDQLLSVTIARKWDISLSSILRDAKALSSSARPAEPANSSGPPKNRIYVLTQASADFHPDVITGSYLLNNTPAYFVQYSCYGIFC